VAAIEPAPRSDGKGPPGRYISKGGLAELAKPTGSSAEAETAVAGLRQKSGNHAARLSQ
jgi:hypothetical protein